MESYLVYGVPFRSALPFLSPLPLTSRAADLEISEQFAPIALEGMERIGALPEEYWDRAAPQYVYRSGETDVLLFPGGDQILLGPSTMVYAHAGQHAIQRDLMDVRLLGSGFAWWMLRRGRLPFHAGAMVVEEQAVLFSAASQTGKSSLMCSLMQRGIPLLCDDFTTLSPGPGDAPLAASAYPQMRLWPRSVRQFVGDPDEHPPLVAGHVKRRVRVGEGWGRFLEGSYPVSRIYFLERLAPTAPAVEVTPLAGHEAFMTLLAAVSLGSLYPTASFQPLLAFVQQIAWQVPVYRLAYPSGWHWLPAVHEAVFAPDRFLAELHPISPWS